jgi:hypothetical protein
MDSTRIKKYQYIKILLMFVIMIILFLPVNGLSFEIKRMKITRIGDIQIHNSITRPVMIIVTYSCDNNPKKLLYIERETYQVRDKWGEWITHDFYIKTEIQKKLCGEKTDSEKREEKQEEEREREKERILKEKERILKEEGNLGREWVAYERDDKGKYHYDNKHIKIVHPNVIQVWDKLEFDNSKEQLIELKKRKKKIKPDSIKKSEEKLIVLQEIDCTNKTHKVIRSISYKTEYDPYEEPIDVKNTIPTNITDRSTNMTLLEKVCSKEKLEETNERTRKK